MGTANIYPPKLWITLLAAIAVIETNRPQTPISKGFTNLWGIFAHISKNPVNQKAAGISLTALLSLRAFARWAEKMG